MSVYSTVKRIYKFLVPKRVRHSVFLLMPLPLKRLKHNLIGIIEKTAEHNEIYDVEFYNEFRDVYMANSRGAIAESIIEVFSPKSVVDVGCGTGLLLLALKERGISCEGLEYYKAALDICQQHGLKVARFDIEHGTVPPNLRADVAISTEVAEHIPEACADHFVDILCTIAGTVIMTAAEPSPTGFGTNHVNEQPKEYWIRKFQTRGYAYNERISNRWRMEWPEKKVESFYANTVLVFERSP